MHPLRAALFFAYCVLALAATGTTVSHLWRTNKTLANEEHYAALRRADATETPTETIQPNDDSK
jgi:hypothetical protein